MVLLLNSNDFLEVHLINFVNLLKLTLLLYFMVDSKWLLFKVSAKPTRNSRVKISTSVRLIVNFYNLIFTLEVIDRVYDICIRLQPFLLVKIWRSLLHLIYLTIESLCFEQGLTLDDEGILFIFDK